MTDYNAINLDRLAIAAEQIATAISDIAALMAAPAAVKGTGAEGVTLTGGPLETFTVPAQPDADGWIPWHGGPRPVPETTTVEVRYRNPESPYLHKATDGAGYFDWFHSQNHGDIVAYKVVS